MITKNTYLNIAAAKGLRKQLLLTFDKVYILNLHGKLYEKAPDGGKDQNVFDIRVGTAIMILVKTKNKKKETYAKLYYKDLYGNRDFKYDYLTKNNLNKSFTKEHEIEIDENHFFFEKKNFANPELYNSFWSIEELFVDKNSGVETGRDHFILADNQESLKNRLNTFINSDFPIELLRQSFNLQDQPNFKLSKVKQTFKEIDNKKFENYYHKPFYLRKVYYDKNFLRRHSGVIMENFVKGECVGLILKKRFVDKFYSHCFVTENITDRNFLGGQSYIFPLWIYKTDDKEQTSFYKEKLSNFNNNFEKLLQTTYGKENITEEIFYYIYAVLYSNTYRTNFSELLKIDYPKIPFTKNVEVFNQLAELGKKLADLHLLKSSRINKPQVKFIGQGNGKVDKPKYNEKQQIITINETQYFENISKELWEFEVGKNQVIKQWISRKEKIELEDAVEFSKIATAIYETFKIQTKIDTIYPEILNELIEKK